METKITIDFILDLYKYYRYDLRQVRKYQKQLYSLNASPLLDDIEAEITYLLIRKFKPKTVVEISPCHGWSTTWILNALKDNKIGKLYSYDLIDASTRTVPYDLSKDRWTFIQGDVTKNIRTIPKNIDYLFMDSDHSDTFAHWYINNIFPMLKPGTPVSIHDVFHTSDPSGFDKEGKVIIDWLNQKKIEYFTSSSAKMKNIYDTIKYVKEKMGMKESIHTAQTNPMIFFLYKS